MTFMVTFPFKSTDTKKVWFLSPLISPWNHKCKFRGGSCGFEQKKKNLFDFFFWIVTSGSFHLAERKIKKVNRQNDHLNLIICYRHHFHINHTMNISSVGIVIIARSSCNYDISNCTWRQHECIVNIELKLNQSASTRKLSNCANSNEDVPIAAQPFLGWRTTAFFHKM